jgi:hypothetical protein
MKTIFAALASAALLATPMASVSTPAGAQPHGGGFHGGGGFRGAGGGFTAQAASAAATRTEVVRGGHHDRDGRLGLIFGLPYGDAYYYDDPYGYDDGSYDDGTPACGSWSWDDAHGRYVWIPC